MIKKVPAKSEFRGPHGIWEGEMNWHTLHNKQTIMRIIHHLISKKTIVALRIKGEKTTFTSKLLKVTETDLPPDIVAETGWEPEVIIGGVTLKNIKFYSESILITVDGIVRHKTRIREGKYKGCYLLGIEFVKVTEG